MTSEPSDSAVVKYSADAEAGVATRPGLTLRSRRGLDTDLAEEAREVESDNYEEVRRLQDLALDEELDDREYEEMDDDADQMLDLRYVATARKQVSGGLRGTATLPSRDTRADVEATTVRAESTDLSAVADRQQHGDQNKVEQTDGDIRKPSRPGDDDERPLQGSERSFENIVRDQLGMHNSNKVRSCGTVTLGTFA